MSKECICEDATSNIFLENDFFHSLTVWRLAQWRISEHYTVNLHKSLIGALSFNFARHRQLRQHAVIASAFLSTVRLGRHTLWQALISAVALCGLPMCMTAKGWLIVVGQHLHFLMLILQKHFHVFVLTVLFLQTVPVLQHLKQIL